MGFKDLPLFNSYAVTHSVHWGVLTHTNTVPLLRVNCTWLSTHTTPRALDDAATASAGAAWSVSTAINIAIASSLSSANTLSELALFQTTPLSIRVQNHLVGISRLTAQVYAVLENRDVGDVVAVQMGAVVVGPRRQHHHIARDRRIDRRLNGRRLGRNPPIPGLGRGRNQQAQHHQAEQNGKESDQT